MRPRPVRVVGARGLVAGSNGQGTVVIVRWIGTLLGLWSLDSMPEWTTADELLERVPLGSSEH
jgi:hypothetical protein